MQPCWVVSSRNSKCSWNACSVIYVCWAYIWWWMLTIREANTRLNADDETGTAHCWNSSVVKGYTTGAHIPTRHMMCVCVCGWNLLNFFFKITLLLYKLYVVMRWLLGETYKWNYQPNNVDVKSWHFFPPTNSILGDTFDILRYINHSSVPPATWWATIHNGSIRFNCRLLSWSI